MTPGVEVRLFSAYYVTTTNVVKDAEQCGRDTRDLRSESRADRRRMDARCAVRFTGFRPNTRSMQKCGCMMCCFFCRISRRCDRRPGFLPSTSIPHRPKPSQPKSNRVIADVAPQPLPVHAQRLPVADSTDHSAEHPVFRNRTRSHCVILGENRE